MWGAAAVLMAFVAAGVVPALRWMRWRRASVRLFGRVPAPRSAPTKRHAEGAGVLRRSAMAALVGAGAALVVGGGLGLLLGAVLAAGVYQALARARSPADRRAEREEELLTRQLPLSAELLAACLGSATSPSIAVMAVGRSVGAPMGPRLVSIGAELALGAPPELCWGRLGEQHPSLAPLVHCMVRTTVGGAPVAGPLIGLAHAQRTAAGRAAHARVRRAGVLATAPLGLCFLPAFVLIGIVPVVIGLTSRFALAV